MDRKRLSAFVDQVFGAHEHGLDVHALADALVWGDTVSLQQWRTVQAASPAQLGYLKFYRELNFTEGELTEVRALNAQFQANLVMVAVGRTQRRGYVGERRCVCCC